MNDSIFSGLALVATCIWMHGCVSMAAAKEPTSDMLIKANVVRAVPMYPTGVNSPYDLNQWKKACKAHYASKNEYSVPHPYCENLKEMGYLNE